MSANPNEPITLPAPVIDPLRFPRTPWEREYQAFRRLLPQLLQTHRGRYVAVHNEQVVDSGDNKLEVLQRAYATHGYVPIYVGVVAERPLPPERVPHYRIVRE